MSVEIELNCNEVEMELVDITTTGFFLTTLSMSNETKEVAYGTED